MLGTLGLIWLHVSRFEEKLALSVFAEKNFQLNLISGQKLCYLDNFAIQQLKQCRFDLFYLLILKQLAI